MQGLGLQLPSGTNAVGSVGSVSYQSGNVKIDSVPFHQLMQIKDVTKIKNITQDTISSYGANPKSEFLHDASVDIISETSVESNTKYFFRAPYGYEGVRKANEQSLSTGGDVNPQQESVEFSVRGNTVPPAEGDVKSESGNSMSEMEESLAGSAMTEKSDTLSNRANVQFVGQLEAYRSNTILRITKANVNRKHSFREVEEIEESPTGSAIGTNNEVRRHSPDELSEISVAELLDSVKGDAAKYIPKRSRSFRDVRKQKTAAAMEKENARLKPATDCVIMQTTDLTAFHWGSFIVP